jgi:heavy metal sensor kinase
MTPGSRGEYRRFGGSVIVSLKSIASRIPIRWRLTIWYVSLLAGLLVVFSVSVTLGLRFFLYQSLDNTLENQAALLTESIDIENGKPTIGDRRIRNRPGRQFVRLVDQDGELLTDSNPILAEAPSDDPGLDMALRGQQNTRWQNIQDERMRVLSQPVVVDDEVVAVVQVGLSSHTTDSILNQTVILIVAAGGILLLLSIIGGVWLAGRALQPIDNMTRLAAKIGEQDLSRRIESPLSDDEIGRLAQTFNAMLDRLEGGINRQRQFTAAASHELRTPLAMMQGQIELAMARGRDAEEDSRVFETLYGDVNRLTRISAALLSLARNDTGDMALDLDEIELASLFEVIAEQYQPIAENSEIVLDVKADTLWIRGDEDRLIQLLVNLVDNAIEHTPAGKRVALRAVRTRDLAQITVLDEGDGIAPEDMPYIFERFYRAESNRHSSSDGTGLGLSISKMIVEAHGGTIDVRSQPGEGIVMIVQLPVTGPA